MANARKCDICNDYFDIMENEENELKICENSGDESWLANRFDVCPECMDAIKSLMASRAVIFSKRSNDGKIDPDEFEERARSAKNS